MSRKPLEPRGIPGNDVALLDLVVALADRTDEPARLAHQKHARRHVPGVDAALPVTVVAPCRDIGEVERRGAPAAHSGADRHEAAPCPAARPAACRDHRRARPWAKIASIIVRRPDTRMRASFSQAPAPFSATNNSSLAASKTTPATISPCAQRDRDGQCGQPVQEVRRPVERVDDPAPRRVLPFADAVSSPQPAIGRTAAQELVLDVSARPRGSAFETKSPGPFDET